MDKKGTESNISTNLQIKFSGLMMSILRVDGDSTTEINTTACQIVENLILELGIYPRII